MAEANNVFRFFDLPRELRDFVYSYYAKDIQYPSPPVNKNKREISLYVKNSPYISGILVDKQFSQEYQEQINKTATLVFRDHHSCDFSAPTIPRPLRALPVKEIVLLCFGSGTKDIKIHMKWLQTTFSSLTAKSIHIKMYVRLLRQSRWVESKSRVRAKAYLKGLTDTRNPGKLSLFMYYSIGTEKDTEAEIYRLCETGENVLETWSCEDGWVLSPQQAGSEAATPDPDSSDSSDSDSDFD